MQTITASLPQMTEAEFMNLDITNLTAEQYKEMLSSPAIPANLRSALKTTVEQTKRLAVAGDVLSFVQFALTVKRTTATDPDVFRTMLPTIAVKVEKASKRKQIPFVQLRTVYLTLRRFFADVPGYTHLSAAVYKHINDLLEQRKVKEASSFCSSVLLLNYRSNADKLPVWLEDIKLSLATIQ